MAIVSAANHNQMFSRLSSDKLLQEFGSKLATFATETIADCNLALDAAVIQILFNIAYAKQKKYIWQGM